METLGIGKTVKVSYDEAFKTFLSDPEALEERSQSLDLLSANVAELHALLVRPDRSALNREIWQLLMTIRNQVEETIEDRCLFLTGLERQAPHLCPETTRIFIERERLVEDLAALSSRIYTMPDEEIIRAARLLANRLSKTLDAEELVVEELFRRDLGLSG